MGVTSGVYSLNYSLLIPSRYSTFFRTPHIGEGFCQAGVEDAYTVSKTLVRGHESAGTLGRLKPCERAQRSRSFMYVTSCSRQTLIHKP